MATVRPASVSFGAVGLYMWASFLPAHFARAGIGERLFGPSHLQGKVMSFDKVPSRSALHLKGPQEPNLQVLRLAVVGVAASRNSG
ncbi:hypothetical protein B3C1_06238 [Gallaecimonas xiamenensis 3-C-1]|uniref:Uncharacterized protein n=1 Tax=Gallaecimonas xiamenensis 3-C-1 TaxID=745411 RepID=K2IYX8_9GAMM|nr:hypothetical protein B3C1_06238 [Gallaecimonas xiamenensis 3-C-1]